MYFCSQDRNEAYQYTPSHVCPHTVLRILSLLSVCFRWRDTLITQVPSIKWRFSLFVCFYMLPREDVELMPNGEEVTLPFPPQLIHSACTYWGSSTEGGVYSLRRPLNVNSYPPREKLGTMLSCFLQFITVIWWTWGEMWEIHWEHGKSEAFHFSPWFIAWITLLLDYWFVSSKKRMDGHILNLLCGKLYF